MRDSIEVKEKGRSVSTGLLLSRIFAIEYRGGLSELQQLTVILSGFFAISLSGLDGLASPAWEGAAPYVAAGALSAMITALIYRPKRALRIDMSSVPPSCGTTEDPRRNGLDAGNQLDYQVTP
jgi:hypothetical protein